MRGVGATRIRVLQALAVLSIPMSAALITPAVRAKAESLVHRYGHLLADRLGPAQLCQLAARRHRARQTHPGKRGRA